MNNKQKYKKIKLIFLISLFSVLNLGLPYSIHYCEMMRSYSSDECTMCHKTENHEAKKLTQVNKQCCRIINFETNEKNFIQNKTKNESQINVISLITSDNYSRINDTNIFDKLSKQNSIISHQKIDLSILNHTLLI